MDRPPHELLAPAGAHLRAMAANSDLLAQARAASEWFTPGFVRRAIDAVAPWFRAEALADFAAAYPDPVPARDVGVIMAGNIPLVGLHDLLVILLAGHRAHVRLSRKAPVLIPAFVEGLAPALRERVTFHEALRPGDVDFLLATGSDNTARQVAWDFRDTPRLIRRNRFSAAVLTGDETPAELAALTADLLDYHGMGCRSVSNLLVPESAGLRPLIAAIDAYAGPLAPAWGEVLRWETALAGMQGSLRWPCRKLLLQPADAPAPARPATVHVIAYATPDQPDTLIDAARGQLQCVVGRERPVAFGRTQRPALDDFADGVDTMALLTGERFRPPADT